MLANYVSSSTSYFLPYIGVVLIIIIIIIILLETFNFIKKKINLIHHEQQLIQLATNFPLSMLHNYQYYLFLWHILPKDEQVMFCQKMSRFIALLLHMGDLY